jgi:hypothetical protein
MAIEPGGVHEFTQETPNMKEGASSATLQVRSLTFVGGEEWVPAKQ